MYLQIVDTKKKLHQSTHAGIVLHDVNPKCYVLFPPPYLINIHAITIISMTFIHFPHQHVPSS